MQLRIILSPTANATKNHSHLGGKASPGCHGASGLCLGGLEGLGRFLAFCLRNVRLAFGDAAQGQGLTVSVKHSLNIRTLGKSPDDHVRLARTDVQPMARNDAAGRLQGVPDSECVEGDRDNNFEGLRHGL